MDAYTLILFIVVIIGGVIVVTSYFELRKKAMNVQINTAKPKTNNEIQVFEVMDFALNEINKCGEEMLKMGVTADQLKPLRDRYNKLKYLKEHEGIAMPLLSIGKKVLDNFVKGLM